MATNAAHAPRPHQIEGLVGRNAREVFLGRVSQGYGHGRMPVRVARYVTPALEAAFPPPQAIPAFPEVPLDAESWDCLMDFLPLTLSTHEHPLEGGVRNAQYLLALFLVPVVTALSRRTRPRRFQIPGGMTIEVNQRAHGPRTLRIHVTGRVTLYVTRDDAPCCLFEVTRANASLDEAAARVLLLAAAQGHGGGQSPMLAVATDLARWRFFLVTADSYAQSPERRVTYLPDGSPVLPELTAVLEELTSLMAHGI